MKYKTSQIRNIVLLGHQGSGKTTLMESLLYNTKAIERLGTVEDGNTTMDYTPEEIERKNSIYSASSPLYWKDHKINCIDTPGFMDFIAEVKAALKVVEGAVLSVSAVSGIEVGLEKVWDYTREEKLARLILINKMDKENANFYKVYEELKNNISKDIIAFQIPIGEAEKFKGIIDLIEGSAWTFENKETKKIDIPQEYQTKYKEYREKLIEKIAETNDKILEKYLLEGIEPTLEELKATAFEAIRDEKIFPVFCVSGYKNIAVSNLLDILITYIPSPKMHKIVSTNVKNKQVLELNNDENAPFCALVYKTTTDPYVGKLTTIRVFSGILHPDSLVYNANKEKEEKISSLLIIKGKSQENIDLINAGDIVTVAKLQVTSTGDTLSFKEQPLILPKIEFPEPIVSLAVTPKSKADEDKLGSGLNRLLEEDQTFKVFRNNETKETIINGMGELHLEILMERLKRKFGVEVTLFTPKIPYKETIRGKTQIEGKYKRQSGGRGQYGHVWLEIEPLERGKNFEFVDKIVGGAIPKNYIPSVEKGIKEAMEGGIISGYPLVDVRTILYDGSYHTVDSSDMAFKIAGAMALKKGVLEARPVLLEPIMNLEVIVPEQNMGDCIGDLNGKRGRILGMEPAQKGYQLIKAQVPLAEIQRYSIDLRSITQGRGNFKMIFSHYEEVPAQIGEQIIARSKQEKEEVKA